jgi:hypothetical protein
MKNGIERWKRSKSAVLLYDTKHGTNRYGLKLGCLTYIDETGKTQVLATSLLMKESENTFEWVCRAFSKAFGQDPVVVFTDSDPATAPAMALAWPDTVHLLCTFHLYKNFYEHIHPLFVQRPNEWKTAASSWWTLCKNSDESMQERFSTEWDALATFIIDNANTNEKKLTETKAWLQKT